MAVLTGIVRVAKENIFSGLNNLMVFDTFKKNFPSYFGLTQKEVVEALEQIDKKNYEVIMQDEKIDHYFKIGISFYKKDLAIKYEETKI